MSGTGVIAADTDAMRARVEASIAKSDFMPENGEPRLSELLLAFIIVPVRVRPRSRGNPTGGQGTRKDEKQGADRV